MKRNIFNAFRGVVVLFLYVFSITRLCLVYVLSMSFICLVFVLSMSLLSIFYVLSMSCLCLVYVLSMACICLVFVMSLYCLCIVYTHLITQTIVSHPPPISYMTKHYVLHRYFREFFQLRNMPGISWKGTHSYLCPQG